MKVLHVIDSLAVGGAERMLVEIANATADDGNHVHVCVTRSGTAMAAFLSPHIDVTELHRHAKWDLLALRRFGRIVGSVAPDIVHVHGLSSFSFVCAARVVRMFAKPVLVHDHLGAGEDGVPAWFGFAARAYLDHYVAVCDARRGWALRAGIPSSSVSVIRNAVSLKRISALPRHDLRSLFSVPADTALGIVIAGIRPVKGIHVLLDALSSCGTSTQTVLAIIGGCRDTAYMRKCEETARALPANVQVRFLGEHQDAISFAKSADYAIIPSLSESGPLVLIEYLASSLPVIYTKAGAIAEQCAAASLSGAVCPGNVDQLRTAITDLCSQAPERRSQRGEEGHFLAMTAFDIGPQMTAWYDTYKKAIGDVQ